MQLKTEDKILIESAFTELPPVAWLVYCLTEDQRNHWDLVRLIYQDIYVYIKAYFSGQAVTPLNQYQETYNLMARSYIHFYNVIFDAWNEIVKAGNKDGITFDSPGKLLIQVIEMDCAARLQQCLEPYSEVSPRKWYKQDLNFQKAKKDGLFDNENPSKKDLQKLKRIEAELRGQIRGYELFSQLRWFILSVAKKSKNENVKQSLEVYFATCDRFNAHTNKKFNRIGIVHKWINGERS